MFGPPSHARSARDFIEAVEVEAGEMPAATFSCRTCRRVPLCRRNENEAETTAGIFIAADFVRCSRSGARDAVNGFASAITGQRCHLVDSGEWRIYPYRVPARRRIAAGRSPRRHARAFRQP